MRAKRHEPRTVLTTGRNRTIGRNDPGAAGLCSPSGRPERLPTQGIGPVRAGAPPERPRAIPALPRANGDPQNDNELMRWIPLPLEPEGVTYAMTVL